MDKIFKPCGYERLFPNVQNLHTLSQISLPLNIHVFRDVKACYILEGHNVFMCMVKKSKTRMLYPEDGGTELFQNVDSCESTQRNIINAAVGTSNLATCTLYHCTKIACSATTVMCDFLNPVRSFLILKIYKVYDGEVLSTK